MEIRQVGFEEVTNDPAFATLAAEYKNSAAEGMPEIDLQEDVYTRLELAGTMATLAAYVDGTLVGFINVLVTIIPHYGVPLGTTESFFVAPEHRSTGAGLVLLRRAEELAVSMGAVGLMVSAPVGRSLDKVLSRSSYDPMSTIYFRRLQ